MVRIVTIDHWLAIDRCNRLDLPDATPSSLNHAIQRHNQSTSNSQCIENIVWQTRFLMFYARIMYGYGAVRKGRHLPENRVL